MALLNKRKVILAKVEGTYGTDPTLTGAANAILTSNLEITPITANLIDRELNRPTLGLSQGIHDGVHVECSFDVELAGSGIAPASIADASDAAAWSTLLRGCGFSVTATPTTSTHFLPVSSSFESLTLYYNLDGQFHKITGARGTFSLAMNSGELPKFTFNFTGLYNEPTSTVPANAGLSDAVFTAFIKPLAVNDTNTTAVTLSGTNLIMESLSVDVANDIQYRNVVGDEKVLLVDRAVTGSVTFEAPALSGKNWFTHALADGTGALQIVHGTVAGNIITIDAPAVQLTEPSYGESQGVVTLSANLRLVPNAGDDEIKITNT